MLEIIVNSKPPESVTGYLSSTHAAFILHRTGCDCIGAWSDSIEFNRKGTPVPAEANNFPGLFIVRLCSQATRRHMLYEGQIQTAKHREPSVPMPQLQFALPGMSD